MPTSSTLLLKITNVLISLSFPQALKKQQKKTNLFLHPSTDPPSWIQWHLHKKLKPRLNEQEQILNLLITIEEKENAARDFVSSIKTSVCNSTYQSITMYSIKNNAFELLHDLETLIVEKRRFCSRWQGSGLFSDKWIFNYMSTTIKNLM